ncbi:MAG TPA: hypothetical protein VGE29_09815 [Prosthecobacter sp.]
MNRIDEILQERRKADPPPAVEAEVDKFYSVLVGEAIQEHFMELRFSNGLQTCFSYLDLAWFNHDPESGCIDLSFGGFLVTLKGRGLAPLFQAVKQKRVGWVKEADNELQDHEANSSFIESITITPPKEFSDEEDTTS